jgi:hypothetical protein
MPSAPNSRAFCESAGVSAFVRIFNFRCLSAHVINMKASSSMVISDMPCMIGSALSTIVYFMDPAEKFVSPCFLAPPTIVA